MPAVQHRDEARVCRDAWEGFATLPRQAVRLVVGVEHGQRRLGRVQAEVLASQAHALQRRVQCLQQ